MSIAKVLTILFLSVSSGEQSPIPSAGSSAGTSAGTSAGSSAGTSAGSSAKGGLSPTSSPTGYPTSSPTSGLLGVSGSFGLLGGNPNNNSGMGRPNCSFFTCGAACQGSCGWSSVFNRCMYGFTTTASEMNRGPGCRSTNNSSDAPSFAPTDAPLSSSAPSSVPTDTPTSLPTDTPSTAAPSTSAPSTSAPSTAAPSTSAPYTSAPSFSPSFSPSSAPSTSFSGSSSSVIGSSAPTDAILSSAIPTTSSAIPTTASPTSAPSTDASNPISITPLNSIQESKSSSSSSRTVSTTGLIVGMLAMSVFIVIGVLAYRKNHKVGDVDERVVYEPSDMRDATPMMYSSSEKFYVTPTTVRRRTPTKNDTISSNESYYEEPVANNTITGFINATYSSVFSPQNQYDIPGNNNGNEFYDNVASQDLTGQPDVYDFASNNDELYEMAHKDVNPELYDLASSQALYDLAGSESLYDDTGYGIINGVSAEDKDDGYIDYDVADNNE